MATRVKWELCREHFVPDGSLRDIYVVDTDVDVWRRALSLLLSTSDSVRHRVAGGVELPAVDSAEQLLPYLKVGNPTHAMVAFWRDGIEYVCHFFAVDEIELDIELAAIDGPKALDALVRLVEALGRATERGVSVTRENCRDEPFLAYSPTADEVVLVARASGR
jgi:hypothetical protein